jgi:hypothetical protein
MIAEHGPGDKLRFNQAEGIPREQKKPSRHEPGRLLDTHDDATRYGFGVAGVAGLGAGLVAGAAEAVFTG